MYDNYHCIQTIPVMYIMCSFNEPDVIWSSLISFGIGLYCNDNRCCNGAFATEIGVTNGNPLCKGISQPLV